MAKTALKSYALAEMKDKYIGKVETKERDGYEYELGMDIFRANDKNCPTRKKINVRTIG
jgi:HTH-type transcriptional regulator / antitoxin HipB